MRICEKNIFFLLQNLKKKNHEEFSQVVKNIKDCGKVRINGACTNLLLKNLIKLQFLAIYLHFLSFQLTILPSWIRIHADPDPQPWNIVIRKISIQIQQEGLFLFE